MNNLLNFFRKHSAWFVFVIYLIAGCVLLFKNNPYQQNVFLTSANVVSASVYEALSVVTSYFHLHEINEDLQKRNSALELELIKTRSQLREAQTLLSDTVNRQPALAAFEFIPAHVISNSIAQPDNYITINRGSADGIKPEMGVVDQNGVVGIVDVVAPHSARLISLLNPHMRLSCKFLGSDFFGSLVWQGNDSRYAVLEQLPHHIKWQKGDTIVTSGYSAVFPEGIIVGVVESRAASQSDSFVALRVRLTTNFSQLSAVRVVRNYAAAEIKSLQRDSVTTGNTEKR